MKVTNILLSFLIAMFFMSCGGTKKLETVTKSQEISLPFSETKYKTDKDFFRAKNVGKSPDVATAKKIALQNAKTELASNIKSLTKRVLDQYTNQRSIGDKQEYENKFEEQTREVVSQTLTDIRIIDEKVFKETDGSYSYWVVIETSKQSMLDGITKKITNNEKLQLDYDKKKFEETFNNEMEKLSKDQ